jgi:multiple sugar transport system substrate-binding protein
LNDYAPKLTKNGKYAYALQSRRGETQSCDSFMRFIWPWGGSLLDPKFKSNLMNPKTQQGLEFREKLMKYMPPGIPCAGSYCLVPGRNFPAPLRTLELSAPVYLT